MQILLRKPQRKFAAQAVRQASRDGAPGEQQIPHTAKVRPVRNDSEATDRRGERSQGLRYKSSGGECDMRSRRRIR